MRALLFSNEQPNVPDRNHRLIREGLQQRNLALWELFSVGSCNRDRSNGVAIKQQRHCHDASIGYRLGENQGTVGGILTNLMVYVNRRLLGQQRDKLYREALRMELAAAGEDLKKLREIARVHIEKAAAGDMQAIKELADRLDGRPAQILEHSGPETPVIRFVREIVHVTETRESLDKEINADFTEVKAISSNGHGD